MYSDTIRLRVHTKNILILPSIWYDHIERCDFPQPDRTVLIPSWADITAPRPCNMRPTTSNDRRGRRSVSRRASIEAGSQDASSREQPGSNPTFPAGSVSDCMVGQPGHDSPHGAAGDPTKRRRAAQYIDKKSTMTIEYTGSVAARTGKEEQEAFQTTYISRYVPLNSPNVLACSSGFDATSSGTSIVVYYTIFDSCITPRVRPSRPAAKSATTAPFGHGTRHRNPAPCGPPRCARRSRRRRRRRGGGRRRRSRPGSSSA